MTRCLRGFYPRRGGRLGGRSEIRDGERGVRVGGRGGVGGKVLGLRGRRVRGLRF